MSPNDVRPSSDDTLTVKSMYACECVHIYISCARVVMRGGDADDVDVADERRDADVADDVDEVMRM